ncbi:MAG: methyltransferase domain-containing protein [Alphaproteobacteria bacterium]|nr:methyltransferase domain-containing protein [Alphaproteobacteria bacterium]
MGQLPKEDSRSAALSLLGAVLSRRRPLDEAMEADAGFLGLEPRDRAFAHRLTAAVLRRLGQIDAMIGHCLERPLTGKRADVRDVLRLGVCQLMFLGTAPHAAIDTSVNLASRLHSAAYRGLVNAVLRRIGREGPELLSRQDEARLNTPPWLWESWSKAYGEEDCRRIAQAVLGEAPLDLTVKGDPAPWIAPLEAERLPTGTLRRPPGGLVTELPGFGEGAWWVQDAAAALPARLLGDVNGWTVADLCAAPGGKTAQLAAAGARVIAVDRSEARLRRLSANLDRLGLRAETVVADAASWRPETPVDAVLLDAPCSATGTIRRHPDVAHLKTPGDVAGLTGLQDRLLRAAVDKVRPGGLLIYCVCSLQPEEGAERVQAALGAALGAGLPLRRVPVTPAEVGGLAECVTGDGDLRTMPFHLADKGGMDAFYAARLQRV